MRVTGFVWSRLIEKVARGKYIRIKKLMLACINSAINPNETHCLCPFLLCYVAVC